MRYIIGIDLGTTNCCVAYVDQESPQKAIQLFRIPQFTAPGYLEAEAMLPSFCLLEAPKKALPWGHSTDYSVGILAREQGSVLPTKLVSSAKSWLCHAATNRKEKILPPEAADEKARVSPVEATSRYLRHIKDAWNHVMAKDNPELECEQQQVIITVPASFDEVARALTAEAAQAAGFRNIAFLEEPQAAFYAWIAHHQNEWTSLIEPGQSIVVCDVGGGTTDFSLIEVNEEDGQPAFQRMAVGNHLLLGGDNIDRALAHFFEEKLQAELSISQWLQLMHQARAIKELIFTEKAPETCRIVLQAAGSSIVQNTLVVEASREELKAMVINGFFPTLSWEDSLKLHKMSGFKAMGLPYEAEAAVTKHLAYFLSTANREGIAKPDFLLFNGGTMKPNIFQQKVLEALQTWLPDKQPRILANQNLDLAVARGAAYFGLVKNGAGIRIKAGTPRGYYLAIETKDQAGNSEQKALTLLPRGTHESGDYESPRTFWLMPNTPVSFLIYTSHVRLYDRQEDLVDIEPDEMHALPPIHTLLRYGKATEAIPVHLSIRLSEIGTLELALKAQKTEHRWALEFQLQSGSANQVRSDETYDANIVKNAVELVTNTFTVPQKPNRLIESLEETLQKPKKDWPPSILRSLAGALLEQAPRRKASPEHESRWWNLAGYFLRPGYGYPLDEHRVKDLWKVILAEPKSGKISDQVLQRWICYRRISGGLLKGQQMQLANELLPYFFNKKTNRMEIKGKKEEYAYSENLRALASFEYLDASLKIAVGNAILHRIEKREALPVDYWALGRIGARQQIYGTFTQALSKETITDWIQKILKTDPIEQPELPFLLVQLGRKTDHREINLPQSAIEQILAKMQPFPQIEHLREVFTTVVPLSENEEEQAFGEKYPIGLTINKEE